MFQASLPETGLKPAGLPELSIRRPDAAATSRESAKSEIHIANLIAAICGNIFGLQDLPLTSASDPPTIGCVKRFFQRRLARSADQTARSREVTVTFHHNAHDRMAIRKWSNIFAIRC